METGNPSSDPEIRQALRVYLSRGAATASGTVIEELGLCHDQVLADLRTGSYDVDRTEEDKAEEKEADTFASYFPMPEGPFNKEREKARGLPLFRMVISASAVRLCSSHRL